MWIDWSSGMIHSTDWIVTLKDVVWSQAANSRTLARSG
jgi:hypothetical protein